jgi:hypothetical protein
VDGAHLAAMRVRDIRLERTLALVSRPERDLLPPARVFRHFLEERFVSPAARSEPLGS